MTLQLGNEIHGHDHDNEQRGAAEIELDVKPVHQKLRNQAHKDHVDRTRKGQSAHDLVNELGRLLTRPDARDERSALLEVIGNLTRIENKSREIKRMVRLC